MSTSVNEKKNQMVAGMKNDTFGVEVEMYGITRIKAAGVVAKYFDTAVQHDWTIHNCYDGRRIMDASGRWWKVMRDSSIIAPEEQKVELVTPILRWEDMETLQGLIRALRKAGALSDKEHSCGVHIHVGGAGQTPATVRNLVNIMASHEDLIADAIGMDKHSTRYLRWAQVTDPRFLAQVNRRKPQTMDELAEVWYTSQGCTYRPDWGCHYNSTRYHMLNLHALFTKGTLEFRMFQFDSPENGRKGGLHAGLLKSYIQLCLGMCELAKSVKTASPKPQQTENPKFAMRTWMCRMGMQGEEFATARKLLTRRLAGNAAFRYAAA